ncbi:MAG: hypothetical protein HYS25_01790 [Ignavibacteriales bacterium]|nr:hypothetical protein [Ignavibacteriales bacterium]
MMWIFYFGCNRIVEVVSEVIVQTCLPKEDKKLACLSTIDKLQASLHKSKSPSEPDKLFQSWLARHLFGVACPPLVGGLST